MLRPAIELTGIAWLALCPLPTLASTCQFLEFRRAEPTRLGSTPYTIDPFGLAWDGEHILVATGAGPVLSYPPELVFGSLGQLFCPNSTSDVAYLDGAIYGYSTVKGRFERWDTDGYDVIELPWAGPSQGGITADGTYLYVSTKILGSDDNLAVFDGSGHLYRSFKAPCAFDGLAYTMGELYGLSGWQIYRMTMQGEVLGVQTIPVDRFLGFEPTGGLTAYHRFLIVGFPEPSPWWPCGYPETSYLVELEIVWTRDVRLSVEGSGTVVTWDCDSAYSGYRVQSTDALGPDPLWRVRYQILGVPAWQRSLSWTDTETGTRRNRFYRIWAIE